MKKRRYVKLKIQKNLFTQDLEKIFIKKRAYKKRNLAYWAKKNKKGNSKENDILAFFVQILFSLNNKRINK